MDFSCSDASRAQQLVALDRANRVRSVRSEVKRQIGRGELAAAEVILGARWELERMPVAEILISQPSWGATRCRRFMNHLRLPEAKTIGSMTARQRTATAAQLAFATTREPDLIACYPRADKGGAQL